MKIPEFTAEAALGKSTRIYHGKYLHDSPFQNWVNLSAILPSQLDLEGMESLEDLEEAEWIGEIEMEHEEVEAEAIEL